MGTEKRSRQKQSRQERIEREQHERAAARRRRVTIRLVSAAVLVLAVVGVLALINRNDDDQTVATEPVVTVDPFADETTPPVDSTEPAPLTEAVPDGPVGDAPCPAEDGSSEQVTSFNGPPQMCIDATALYRATLDTSAGTIVMELDPSLDPISVNNFVFLSRYHYYDGSTFHRVIRDFVIQGGDPIGDPPGTGGPGYDFTGGTPPEPAEGETAYAIGDVAMANRADPSSNGAQFFIVTGPNGAGLPANYSPLGRVVDGLDVALAVQEVETGDGDQPVEDVVVNSVTISTVG